MAAKERQKQILEILEKQGYVTVNYLTEVLEYSTATINRDLNTLQERQLVTRSHGGVELNTPKYIPVLFRTHKMQREKRLIGKTAASFVEDGDTIFIDGSTTAQCMEQYLLERKDITVITNNMSLCANLSTGGVNAICLGGAVKEPPSMLYSDETIENAARYRVNKMFFSTDAISSSGLIASGIYYDLLFKTVANNAEKVFYLFDHNKLDRPFNVVLWDLDRVDCVISDLELPKETREKFPNTRYIVTPAE